MSITVLGLWAFPLQALCMYSADVSQTGGRDHHCARLVGVSAASLDAGINRAGAFFIIGLDLMVFSFWALTRESELGVFEQPA